MTDTDSIHAAPVEAAAPTDAPSSILAALRSKREALAADRHLDVDVPGYGGLLVLRLGVVPSRQLAVVAEKAERSNSPDAAFNANADLLIQACVEVLGRERDDADLQPLDDADPQVRIDARLAGLLQLDGSTARATLRGLFALANSPDYAVAVAAARYGEWMGQASLEVDEDLAGEF